ncbi:MAG: hypothetical protein FJ271_27480 [Planctomycetes bacterium]|nr:hypothetical protein [Planctomycetota bacterium]
MDPAFTWSDDIVETITVDDKVEKHSYAHRDQVAAEILYFSNCVLTNQEPEPSGLEGMVDVRIIEALRKSYEEEGRPIRLTRMPKDPHPDGTQSIERPPQPQPKVVNAAAPRKS